MKDHLLSIAASEPEEALRLNRVREYLQAWILRSIQDAGGFASLAFQGGTALRFLHGLRRFSEDLDFALERRGTGYDFQILLKRIEKDLLLAAYSVEVTRLRTEKPVHSALLKFPGLLQETELSRMRAAKLAIRIEVDSNPPAGATFETRLVTRHFPIAVLAHDLPSCLSGKIHALLCRGHAKGRDLLDLAWYLTHPGALQPNFTLLRNALQQSAWKGAELGEGSWRAVVASQIESLDWDRVVDDVLPFLEDPRDKTLLDRALLLSELERRPK